jgi:hypothetical protein
VPSRAKKPRWAAAMLGRPTQRHAKRRTGLGPIGHRQPGKKGKLFFFLHLFIFQNLFQIKFSKPNQMK